MAPGHGANVHVKGLVFRAAVHYRPLTHGLFGGFCVRMQHQASALHLAARNCSARIATAAFSDLLCLKDVNAVDIVSGFALATLSLSFMV